MGHSFVEMSKYLIGSQWKSHCNLQTNYNSQLLPFFFLFGKRSDFYGFTRITTKFSALIEFSIFHACAKFVFYSQIRSKLCDRDKQMDGYMDKTNPKDMHYHFFFGKLKICIFNNAQKPLYVLAILPEVAFF